MSLMRIVSLPLFLALVFLPKLSPGAAPSSASIGSFDLFSFQLSSLDQGLGKRAHALGQSMTAAFPKDFKTEDFKGNYYNGRCFISGADQYKLSWMDSETEGFAMTVERLKDQKVCASPFSEGQSFKSGSLPASQFFPLSRSHSSIQLGVSTPAQIQKELGKPDYSSPSKLIYAFKRSKEKEKACGSDPKQGEIDAIAVHFVFSNGVLQSVALVNSIAGEC